MLFGNFILYWYSTPMYIALEIGEFSPNFPQNLGPGF